MSLETDSFPIKHKTAKRFLEGRRFLLEITYAVVGTLSISLFYARNWILWVIEYLCVNEDKVVANFHYTNGESEMLPYHWPKRRGWFFSSFFSSSAMAIMSGTSFCPSFCVHLAACTQWTLWCIRFLLAPRSCTDYRVMTCSRLPSGRAKILAERNLSASM